MDFKCIVRQFTYEHVHLGLFDKRDDVRSLNMLKTFAIGDVLNIIV